MGLDFSTLSPAELLAVESAALTMRSLMEAARTAPHGHGMECLEAALHEKGFEHLRTMLQAAMASHEGAQKGGPAAGHVPAATTPRSSAVATRRS